MPVDADGQRSGRRAYRRPMHLDLSEADATALAELLRDAIAADRFPLSPSCHRKGQKMLIKDATPYRMRMRRWLIWPTEEASTTQASSESPLKRIRDSHHAAARALAEGHSVEETATLVGKASETINSLKRDPAFQELMAHYAKSLTQSPSSADHRQPGTAVEADTGRSALTAGTTQPAPNLA